MLVAAVAGWPSSSRRPVPISRQRWSNYLKSRRLHKRLWRRKKRQSVTVLAADAASAPLPGSYDIAVLQRVLQVLSPDDARQVVCNTGAAINPGGTIYIVGQILDDSRTSPISAVAANLTWINLYTAGESYTEYEHRLWLSEAGFVDIERANFFVAEGLGVLTARKQG